MILKFKRLTRIYKFEVAELYMFESNIISTINDAHSEFKKLQKYFVKEYLNFNFKII